MKKAGGNKGESSLHGRPGEIGAEDRRQCRRAGEIRAKEAPVRAGEIGAKVISRRSLGPGESRAKEALCDPLWSGERRANSLSTAEKGGGNRGAKAEKPGEIRAELFGDPPRGRFGRGKQGRRAFWERRAGGDRGERWAKSGGTKGESRSFLNHNSLWAGDLQSYSQSLSLLLSLYPNSEFLKFFAVRPPHPSKQAAPPRCWLVCAPTSLRPTLVSIEPPSAGRKGKKLHGEK